MLPYVRRNDGIATGQVRIEPRHEPLWKDRVIAVDEVEAALLAPARDLLPPRIERLVDYGLAASVWTQAWAPLS